MNMKRITAGIICLIASSTVSTAKPTSIDQWADKPVMHKVDSDFANADAVIIDQSVKLEFKDIDKQVYTYRTLHRLVKVLDEKGIESFNKMNFPTYEGVEIITLKARTILPDGRVFEVTKDKMKTAKGDDGSSEIVFAMEGVEKNAEIELIYCYKRAVSLFGTESYQFSIPVMHAGFELQSPKRLVYEGKGYNGFPDTHDSVADYLVRYSTADKYHIPALENEVYSFNDLNRMRIDYKVSYLPEERANVRMFTWQDLVKRMYDNTYQVNDKEKKAVEKYLITLGVNDKDTDLEKIKKIENGIKNNITYYKEIADENAWRIDNIIAKKSATESGLNRLFAACFLQAGVACELGVTSDRFQSVFDNEFENWNLMENYVFYFPSQKKFLFPTGTYYRFPVVPSSMLSNKGVFCKLMSIGDVTNAIADIRTITPLPVVESFNNVDATITFNEDMEAKTDVIYSFSGYCATGIREAAVLLPKDKIKDFVQSIVSLCDKPEHLLKYSLANEAFENYYDGRPLQFIATVSTPQLTEKAGPKYILKIGDVIGKQEELYQNTNRKLPIDISYPHSLNRTITVIIPDGYKVLNPETININAEMKDADGKPTCGFHSSYTLVGNKLVVTINEFYAQLHYAVTDYEAYRKVINASADFNKVNLLLSNK